MTKSRVTNLRAGEEVKIMKGIRFFAPPVKAVMTMEYPHFIAIRAFFRVRNPITGERRITEHIVTASKASIYCGSVVLRRASDGETVRAEVTS